MPKLPQAPYTDNNGSSIDYFKNNFLKAGLSKPTRYSVLVESAALTPNRMMFQPEMITLPGRSFKVIEDNLWGPSRQVPVGRNFQSEVVMTFPVGSDWEERTIFEAWMDSLIDPEFNDTSYSEDGVTAKGTMTIYLMNDLDKTKAMFEFQEVYPSSIIPMNMGFDNRSQYNRTQIIFNYRQYRYIAGDYETPLGVPEDEDE